MHALTPLAKVWYNFLCVKIKPSMHLSTVTKDKKILLYAMTKGFQFDLGTVIERGLIESTHVRCTGALIHPSLITQLCRSAGVPMLDSEEQVQQCLPIPLPRVKFGSPDESDDETKNDVLVATPNVSDHWMVTLRSHLVRPSPWPIRSMHSPPASKPIGTSLRSTELP